MSRNASPCASMCLFSFIRSLKIKSVGYSTTNEAVSQDGQGVGEEVHGTVLVQEARYDLTNENLGA